MNAKLSIAAEVRAEAPSQSLIAQAIYDDLLLAMHLASRRLAALDREQAEALVTDCAYMRARGQRFVDSLNKSRAEND